VGQLSQRFRRALVTGSSSGLGRAFTEHLISEGVSVVGLSRRPEIPEISEAYTPWPLDLSDSEALAEALDSIFERFPDIDLVINNAGFGLMEHLQSQSNRGIQGQYRVMLESPALIASRALAHFDAQGRQACLCNVASLAVELPLPLMPVYNSCKAGLSALSQSLILDASGAAKNYQVIDFRPGDFNTRFGQRMEGRAEWNGVDLREGMDRHHSRAPSPDRAVRVLHRALVSGRSGVFSAGTFFQSYVAPFGARIFCRRLLYRLIKSYYRR